MTPTIRTPTPEQVPIPGKLYDNLLVLLDTLAKETAFAQKAGDLAVQLRRIILDD